MPPLPRKPGVYYFLAAKGKILYVGKARNLHNRVQSYKYGRTKDPKTKVLLKNAKKLKIIQLESDLEAILVEADLIRIHQPKYNLRLKDDKSPIYILITNDYYPRVLIVRRSDLLAKRLKGTVFGPFPSSYQTRLLLKTARRIFPFCNASDAHIKNKKPCFYLHLNICPGVCAGTISRANYLLIINSLKIFLKGNTKSVLKDIEKRMKNASKDFDFESAARFRDQHRSIVSLINNPANFTWHEDLQKKDPRIAREKLWKYLSPIFAKSHSSLPKNPFQRIEAFDVSNISGKMATASMVVFTDGIPDPSQYRRFRIRWTEEPHDINMISEAVYRRLKHREWKYPQLMVIDGGKGQVRAVVRVLAAFGIHHTIPVIGLAKRFETIYVYKHTFHILRLKINSQALLLLMHIRDCAHRFAKKYHQYLHNRQLFNNKI